MVLCCLQFFSYIVKGIFRQAMHEMPLVTLCTPFLIAGCGLLIYHTYRYDKNDGNNRKYKLKYTRKYNYGSKLIFSCAQTKTFFFDICYQNIDSNGFDLDLYYRKFVTLFVNICLWPILLSIL